MRGTRWGWTNIRFPPSCQSIATAVASAPVPAVRRDGDDRRPGHDVGGRRQAGGQVEWVGERGGGELGGVEGAAAADHDDGRDGSPVAGH